MPRAPAGRFSSFVLVVLFAGLGVACPVLEGDYTHGFTTTDAGPPVRTDAGTISEPPCSLLLFLSPPVLTVVNAATGASICDPTFAIINWSGAQPPPPDAGGAVPCAGSWTGCPAPPDGADTCAYALEGLVADAYDPGAASFTIEVSKPGFESTVVEDIHAGISACPGPNVLASQVTVELRPVDAGEGSDAATEAGPASGLDDASHGDGPDDATNDDAGRAPDAAGD